MNKFEKTVLRIRVQRIINTLGILLPLALLVFFSVGAVKTYGEWRSEWSIHFQNPIRIDSEAKAYQPILGIKHADAAEIKLTPPKDPKDMTTEEYIVHKFGKDSKIALAVSQAENGTRQCDRFGVNKNKTIDVGVFQINTVHLKKGWTLRDLTDCHKNIDYAYEIFQAQGWTPWVTYNNGAYKKFLK